MFRAAVDRRPEATALVAATERVTYLELDQRVVRLASHLSAWGLRRGERLGLLLGNRPEFAIVVLAASRLGLVVVPMDVRQRQPEIAFALAHSEAACLVIDSTLAHEMPASAEIPCVRYILEVGGHRIARARIFDETFTDTPAVPVTPAQEEDPFCILYTSGTTGRPKGAVLTHLGIVHSVLHYQYSLGLHEGDVAVLAVPASHVTGLIAIILVMLRVAGTIVFIEVFKANAFLKLAARERMSYTLIVPAMYNLCLLDPDFARFDLRSWRIGGFGGGPMPVVTIERLARELPGLALANIYGATETTSPATMLVPGDVPHRPDSVGRALPCAEIIICDEDGRAVTSGHSGELWIAGPMTIPRYWNDPVADESSFVHGFWRSGDLGSIDAEGYVRILDRKKDMINRAGYKIYCIEIENLIAAHPNVRECALVGQPDPILGERSHAFVVPNGEGLNADELRSYCVQRLSDYKVPDFITLLDAPLPRNANGKILKGELRKRAVAEST
jgi:long-chain acyl-CoA synthetase